MHVPDAPRRLDEGSGERALDGVAMGEGLSAESHDCLADFISRRGAWKRRPEADRDRVRDAARPLEKELAALEAEDASPDAIQVYGNDGCLDAFHDSFEAAPERQQLACSGPHWRSITRWCSSAAHSSTTTHWCISTRSESSSRVR